METLTNSSGRGNSRVTIQYLLILLQPFVVISVVKGMESMLCKIYVDEFNDYHNEVKVWVKRCERIHDRSAMPSHDGTTSEKRIVEKLSFRLQYQINMEIYIYQIFKIYRIYKWERTRTVTRDSTTVRAVRVDGVYDRNGLKTSIHELIYSSYYIPTSYSP